MRGTSIHKRKTARRGIAYVALLLLLTLLFTLGMVFLMQTANDSAAVLVRGNSMQAHYLAESAANHALWLLLNEDVYSLDSDTYYMHSFAGGRYGYKIRPHTDTTFATIATVGAIGDSVVRQSYVVYVAPPKEPINLMFLTSGLLFPTSQESDRIALMESWGFAVDTLYTGSWQSSYDAMIAWADVAYISEEASATSVGTKMTQATIGVVNEEIALSDELQFSSGKYARSTLSEIDIVDNTHDITQPFKTGPLTLFSREQEVYSMTAPYATDFDVLAETPSWRSANPSLAVIEAGGLLQDGSAAAGRRVQLPWGGSDFDFATLNADGQTLMRKSLLWASSPDAGLMVHYNFDEDRGATVAIDSSGNGYDAQLSNMDYYGNRVTGVIGGALRFDGWNDYIISKKAFTPPTVGTVAFWMQLSGYPRSDGTILGSDTAFEIRHLGRDNRYGTPYTLVFDLMTNYGDEFKSDTLFGNAGVWYHVAALFNSADGTYRVYVNGELENSGTRRIDDAGTDFLSVGVRTGSNEYFQGVLDDLRIYQRELRTSEIEQLYEMNSATGSGKREK